MQKFLKKITDIGMWISAFCLFSLPALIVIGIFFRYILQKSLPWTTELSQFLLMWMVYLGTAAVSLKREHITADVIGIILSERGKKIRDFISETLNLGLIVMIMWKLIPYTITLSTRRNASTVMRMPQYIMFITFGIGFALMGLVHLGNAVSIAQKISSNDDVPAKEAHQ
jgi:TRAP-type C4-dicarboxylate transport system permease small subunit